MYECILNDLSSRHRSPFRQSKTDILTNPSPQFPPIDQTAVTMNHINEILFEPNQTPSFNYQDMINNKCYQSMKLTLDDVLVFASTKPEIQSKLRAELIDHFVRQEGDGNNIILRRYKTSNGKE